MTDSTSPPPHSALRRGVATLLVCLPVLAVLMSWVVLQGQLPTQVAIHWSGLGTADGAAGTTTFFTVTLIITGLSALLGGAIALWPGVSPAVRRGTLLATGSLAGMFAVMWLLSAFLTVQAAGEPYDVVLGGWIIVLVGSIAYGLLPYYVAPAPAPPQVRPVAGMALRPTEAGAWSKSISSRMFLWIAVLMVVFLLAIFIVPVLTDDAASFFGDGGAWFSMITFVAGILLVAAFISLRVSVDQRGLRIFSTLLRFPLKRIPLDRIVAVEAVDVLEPAQWGGWGYRVLPGRSALILKRGPGLVVTTTRDKQFALTVDDPETPASLLSTLAGLHKPVDR